MTAPPTTCVHCKRPLGPCFEVTRINKDGQAAGSVRTCSIVCLIQWAYSYGVNRGVAGAIGLKQAITAFLESVKGPK